MNTYLIISGILASTTSLGHFMVGQARYLTPLLNSQVEPVAKTTLHAVFHYISVFLVLSAITLLFMGMNIFSATPQLSTFIGAHYLLFALYQIIIAIQSHHPKPLFTFFQWMLFIPIGLCALLGGMPA